ncbi:DUF2637 domain-containing protein [Sinomonas sp. P10A9]|uniref:DUF2637 domain-containing protein n=1 Tax=Sinomonas puerhi TaxID=3238584 RepID=A0AB39L349_9MICC
MKHKPISRPIVATGIASTVVIGSGAFVLSFSALTDLAVRAGINPEIGWMWPLIVDGMIVAATVAIVALAGREGKEQFYPWILLFFGAVVSTAANSIHAILAVKASNGNVPIAVSALVAAMPPVVLLAITHLTVLLVQYARNSAEIQAALAAAEEMERAASAADAVPAPAPAADAPVAPALTANAAAGGVDVVETVLAETVLADSVRAETAAADASPAAPVVKPAARSSRRTGDTGQIAAVSAADASAEKPKAAPKRKPRKTTTATQPVVPAAPVAKPAAARTAPKAPVSARQLMPELGTVTAVNPILRGSVAADVKPAAEGESKTASASSAGAAATPAVASTSTVASAPAASAATPAPEAAPEVAAEEAAKELVSSPA